MKEQHIQLSSTHKRSARHVQTSSCTGFTGPFPELKQKRSAAIRRLPVPISPGCDLSVPEKTKRHVTKTSLIQRLFPQYMFSNFILKETDRSINNITNMLFFFFPWGTHGQLKSLDSKENVYGNMYKQHELLYCFAHEVTIHPYRISTILALCLYTLPYPTITHLKILRVEQNLFSG